MQETTLSIQRQATSGELATAASAALAKATIEAKFAIAVHRPRSVEGARVRLLENCKRKGFAEGAKWKIPRWDSKERKYVDTEGFSIRFAEAAIQSWGNVDVSANIVFEDDLKRMVRVTVTDLETNISFTDDAVLNKTVERSKITEAQVVIAERLNTEGKKVYIVRATEDELLQKVNSAKSKAIRTSGLRLLPQDILDEAWDVCTDAVAKGGKDPQSDTKKIVDAFATIGVSPTDLEKYLGHPIKSVSPSELDDLRKVFAAVKEGETSWHDYVKSKTVEVKVEPVKEQAKEPAKAEKADDIPMGTTPQDQLASLITSEGISFDTFRAWMIQTSTIDESVVCDDFSMIPTQTADALLAKPKVLNPAIKMMKAGGAK